MYGVFGRDVFIFCNITANPSPRYEWRTERFKIISNPYKYIIDKNSLNIKRLHISDVGVYICTSFDQNNLSQSINITLKRASKQLNK